MCLCTCVPVHALSKEIWELEIPVEHQCSLGEDFKERSVCRETAEWDSSNESSLVAQTDPELLLLLRCFFLFYPKENYITFLCCSSVSKAFRYLRNPSRVDEHASKFMKFMVCCAFGFFSFCSRKVQQNILLQHALT